MRALITGAAKRIGAEMARYLAHQGYDLALHYAASGDEAQALADQIRAMGRKAVCLKADFLCEREVEGLVAQATSALGGPLTCLINNASIFEYDSLHSATRESWDRHMESNLRAPFVLTQHFAAQCLPPQTDSAGEPRASGLVINMIDQRVRKLTPEFMSYTLAKMGLWAFTRTAAQALAPGIRVNAIGPGPTLQGTRQSTKHFTAQRAATPLERGANLDDITAALSYFLTSKSVTGQLLCVDGGQHLGWQTPDILGVEE